MAFSEGEQVLYYSSSLLFEAKVGMINSQLTGSRECPLRTVIKC